ncbi:hypothetical protein PoHVEF18_010406 [Penicillium ochrochloron]
MAGALTGSALPGLDVDMDILTLKCPSQTTVTELTDLHDISRSPSTVSIDSQTTEKCVSPTDSAISSEPSSPTMETPRRKRIEHSSSRSPDSPTRLSGPRATISSRPSSAANSIHHSRSNSRSTARSRPPSRHSSFHSPRRSTNASISIVPVPSSRPNPLDKRESLLALHRESCRLFQDQDHQQPPPSLSKYSTDEPRPTLYRAPSTSYKSRRDGRTSSENDFSAPSSPISSSHSTRRFDPEHRGSVSSMTTPHFLQHRDRSNTMPRNHSAAHHQSHGHGYSPSASSIHVPATVIEWTSPSTRRAEYEKIDRASRGVRGLWRRVAPRWCQTRDSRTPFFEEGKTSREGSVRRFRMDLPDEEESDNKSKTRPWDKRRACRRSKTS